MTPFTWFGVILRALGAWQLLTALDPFVECFNTHKGIFRPVLSDTIAYFNLGVVHAVAGILLLAFAPTLARMAYRIPSPARPVGAEEDNQAASL